MARRHNIEEGFAREEVVGQGQSVCGLYVMAPVHDKGEHLRRLLDSHQRCAAIVTVAEPRAEVCRKYYHNGICGLQMALTCTQSTSIQGVNAMVTCGRCVCAELSCGPRLRRCVA